MATPLSQVPESQDETGGCRMGANPSIAIRQL
jgi:hypothetical protein